MKLTIGITAGGRSSRFGQDKRFVLFQGKPLLEHAVHRFHSFEDIVVSVEDASAVEAVALDSARIVVDESLGIGPIEAISQILKAAKEDYAFILPVDMPLVDERIALFLSTYLTEETDVICPIVDGKLFPLAAIYSKRILPVIEKQKQEGNYRLRAILDRVNTKYVDMAYSCFPPKAFQNLNTQEDYKVLLYPIVFAVSGYKKSGKTSLIEKLIPLFIQEGYRTATLKHDGHDYEIDKEGTDTCRFFSEGADGAIFSDYKCSLNLHGKKSLEEMLSMLSDQEVILVEGAKHSSLPKIQLYREGDDLFPNTFLTLTGDYDTEEVYRKIKDYFSLP